MREVEILKQNYLSKRSTFSLHPDEVKSERAREYISKMDILIARLLEEYEHEKNRILLESKQDRTNGLQRF